MVSKLEQAAQILVEMKEMAQGNAAAMKAVAEKEAAFAKAIEASITSQPQDVQVNYFKLKEIADKCVDGNTTCYVDITPQSNGNKVDSLSQLEEILQSKPTAKLKTTEKTNKRTVTTVDMHYLPHVAGVSFDITHDVGDTYKFISVNSSEWGLDFTFAWRQGTAFHNVSGEICTVTVTGTIDYVIIFQGLGSIYSSRVNYEFDICTKTGELLGFREN